LSSTDEVGWGEWGVGGVLHERKNSDWRRGVKKHSEDTSPAKNGVLAENKRSVLKREKGIKRYVACFNRRIM